MLKFGFVLFERFIITDWAKSEANIQRRKTSRGYRAYRRTSCSSQQGRICGGEGAVPPPPAQIGGGGGELGFRPPIFRREAPKQPFLGRRRRLMTPYEDLKTPYEALKKDLAPIGML